MFSAVALFVAIDAIGVLPIFIALTENLTAEEKQKTIKGAIYTACFVTSGFIFLGKFIFWIVGITIVDFKIAGGILLLILSVHLLLSGKQKRFWSTELGIFPLGTPLLVGPAVLTTLLILIDNHGIIITLLAFVANLGIVIFVFKRSNNIVRYLGTNGIKAVSKVMDIILSAFGVMLIRTALLEIFK